jgi:hypothetical protein
MLPLCHRRPTTRAMRLDADLQGWDKQKIITGVLESFGLKHSLKGAIL